MKPSVKTSPQLPRLSDERRLAISLNRLIDELDDAVAMFKSSMDADEVGFFLTVCSVKDGRMQGASVSNVDAAGAKSMLEAQLAHLDQPEAVH
jgi:hypothetical protein